MKRLLLAFGILGASLSVQADPAFQPLGENLTYGSVSNFQSLSSYGGNPAVGASSLGGDDEWYVGFGVVSSIGISAELGPVDNFKEDIDDFASKIEAIGKLDPNNFNGILDAVDDLKTSFDPFLLKAGEKGYFQAGVAVRPFLPIIWTSKNTLGGSLVFDGSLAVQAKIRVLDSPIIIPDINDYLDGDSGDLDIDMLAKNVTNTHIYLKSGAVAEFSIGYSRPILSLDEGTLSAGIRGRLYQVKLQKKLIPIDEVTDAEKLVKDESKDLSLTADTGYGADFGLLWTSKNYRVGGWLKNINSPSFEYDPVSKNCEAIVDEASKTRCFRAKAFANEVDMEERYVMDAQISLEAAVYNDSRNFVMAASLDTSPVNDPVANEIQWATVSAGYATRSWFIPGVRMGYRKNLAGSQLSAVTAGVTLFKFLHTDVAYGLEKVDVDGNSIPRMLQVNVGVDFLF